MLAGIFASLTEHERDLMHERAAAREASRLLGRHTGRPPKLTAAQARLGSTRSRIFSTI